MKAQAADPGLGRAADGRNLVELAAEFERFRALCTDLREAYARLEERAERIDRELADKNRALEEALVERERVLDSLPLGVFRHSGGRWEPQNRAAAELQARLGGTYPGSDGAGEVDADGRVVVRVTAGVGPERVLRVARIATAGGVRLDFVEDETEVRALREEVERLHRLSSLGTLALGIAHELRNPLNGLAGFAALLARDPRSPKAADWAQRIAEGARRLESLVSDLLAFARPERAREIRRVPLARLLPASGGSNPVVEVVPVDPRLTVRVAPRAFRGVLENLLRNAHEAGARTVRIEAFVDRIECPGPRVRIRVSDDGPGVPEQLRERIFDPFFGTKDGGSGLGLAFAARAVEAMGGTLALARGDGGAVFEIRLEGGFE